MNEFNPSEQEHYTALWFERQNDGTFLQAPIKFKCKEFIKSGRGTSQGQDSIAFSPIQGFETDRKLMNIWTTSRLNFRKGDKIVFNGFKYEVHRVATETSSSNSIAMSEYPSLANSKYYLPFIIEMGR